MEWQDATNSVFTLLGGVSIWTSIYKLYHDKMVRGTHWIPAAFFASWGVWHLYYHAYLEQWFTLVAGAHLALVNFVWLVLIVHYTRAEQNDDH